MAWPEDNTIGNCWCGHTLVEHATIHVVGGPECSQCQCVGYTEDKWATKENANV